MKTRQLAARPRRLTRMLQDLRHAIRTLRKSPGYAVVALLALGLGIGANAAIFSFVDTMLLRPLPYPHAERLYAPVSINPARGSDRASISFADYEDWRRETSIFEAVAVFQPAQVDLTGGGGEPERAAGLRVTEDFFRLVDVQPLVGRPLMPADHAASSPPVVVIGYQLWQRRFGGEPSAVGKDVRVAGVPHEIVGVLGPRAVYPEDTQLFLPMRTTLLPEDIRTRRDNLIFQGIVRLAPGVRREQADARMQAIAARVERENPASRKGWTNGVLPLREYIVEPELQTALYVLLAAVGAVLLIACANLANLTLVRGAGRAREMGVRLAIGASRGRLIRQLATESLVLAIAGGAFGIVLATAAVRGLMALVPPDAPFLEHVALDSRVVIAASVVTLLTVLVVGLLPALSASGVHVTSALKEGGRGASHGRRTSRLRATLVISEIAAAVVLLVTAGLLVRSLDRLTSTPPGADIDRVLAARISLPGARYPQPAHRAEFYRALTTRLATEPGVQVAAATSYLPVGGGGFGLGRVFLAQGQPEPPATSDVPAMWNVISPDYFRTLGIPLVSGRPFTDRDTATSTPVMIVSATFARRMFPGRDAIGQRVRSWRDENVLREIVGVVGNVPFSSLSDRSDALVYVPHAQQGWGSMTLAVRAEGAPQSLAGVVRQAVNALDPELALSNIGTMEVFARDSIARERLSASLMTVLALLALALAVLGIYGVMSYSVAQRRQEMGVRSALGAAPGDLYRLVLGRGLALTATGLAIGFVLAVGASRALTTLLYETSAFDPVAFGGMVLILALTAFLACILPARRAASADPLLALRGE